MTANTESTTVHAQLKCRPIQKQRFDDACPVVLRQSARKYGCTFRKVAPAITVLEHHLLVMRAKQQVTGALTSAAARDIALHSTDVESPTERQNDSVNENNEEQ
jgi:hypothetical protein